MLERKQSFPAEQVPVSSYGGSFKNLKDLKDDRHAWNPAMYQSERRVSLPTRLPCLHLAEAVSEQDLQGYPGPYTRPIYA